jgi:L-arabinose isomerase
MTNTRGLFGPDIRDYIRRWVMIGLTHHFSLGIGHHADTLARIGSILGIETVIVHA